MTTQPHDQFAKSLLEELLEGLGEVRSDRLIRGERRQADLWFAPRSDITSQQRELGLLGQLVSTPCLLEPFRNAVDRAEVRNCLLKLLLLHSELYRQAKRQKTTVPDDDLPFLWILTPTASADLRRSLGATRQPPWMVGVYLLPESYKSGLVVIHQLPGTPDTLWLRLMGRGRMQKRAIEEFLDLPEESYWREKIGDILSSWRTTLEERQTLTEDERELFMNLAPAYLQRKQEILTEGTRTGKRIVVENLLRFRFGELDADLSSIIPAILELSPEEFTPLLMQLSREELLQRFTQSDTQ